MDGMEGGGRSDGRASGTGRPHPSHFASLWALANVKTPLSTFFFFQNFFNFFFKFFFEVFLKKKILFFEKKLFLKKNCNSDASCRALSNAPGDELFGSPLVGENTEMGTFCR